MAINISNVGDLWTVKLFRETWYFKSMDEFSDVFEFFNLNGVSFHCMMFKDYFAVEMKDVNLRVVDYAHLPNVLARCLLFKKLFGDRSRIPSIVPIDYCRPNPEKEEF